MSLDYEGNNSNCFMLTTDGGQLISGQFEDYWAMCGRVSEDLFYDGSLCIMQKLGLITTFAIHEM